MTHVDPRVPMALELIDVRAAYGRIEVLHGIDLVLPPSKVMALLGPNGSGKTTTLKLIDGREVPTGGCVHVAGSHTNGVASDVKARARVCSVPEGRGVFPNMTVAENVRLMSYCRPGTGTKEAEAKAYSRFPVLGERRGQLAGTLSGGQQQMLAVARVLVSDPSLLLVDELSMGLAPQVVGELYDVLGQLAADGMSILVVEQFARMALAIADLAAILVRGEVVASGTPREVEGVLAEAYLGASR